MLTKNTLKLIQLAGSRLAGKPLLIQQRHPATANAWGEVTQCEGQLIITLSPDIPEHKRLYVVLHEIGHTKAHRFIDSNTHRQPPGSQKPDPKTWGNISREDTADQLAAKWQAWAEKHANPILYKAAPLEAALIALLEYPEEGKK